MALPLRFSGIDEHVISRPHTTRRETLKMAGPISSTSMTCADFEADGYLAPQACRSVQAAQGAGAVECAFRHRDTRYRRTAGALTTFQ